MHLEHELPLLFTKSIFTIMFVSCVYPVTDKLEPTRSIMLSLLHQPLFFNFSDMVIDAGPGTLLLVGRLRGHYS